MKNKSPVLSLYACSNLRYISEKNVKNNFNISSCFILFYLNLTF